MTDELDALVRPLVWTEESPNCWFGRGSFGFQRDFRIFDGVAKVRIGTIGARVTPERARDFYDREYVEFVIEAIDTAAVTTLRAQLAAETARADRAEFNAAQLAVMVGEDAVEQIEAAVAAQIERDAGICDEMNRSIWEYDAYECALSIRAQPHDRTALDAAIRAAKVEAWKEAADLPKRTEKLGGQNYAYVRAEEILALIEREGV